jgi:hypothetical protein
MRIPHDGTPLEAWRLERGSKEVLALGGTCFHVVLSVKDHKIAECSLQSIQAGILVVKHTAWVVDEVSQASDAVCWYD